MFMGQFWNAFGYFGNSHNLDNILKQDNLTVETLLDTENIVSEIRQSSQKFTKFLRKNSNYLQQMINYALTLPNPDDTDDKKLYKYPFISSEILGIQLNGLQAIYFDQQESEEEHDEDDEEQQNKTDEEKQQEQQETDTAQEEQKQDNQQTPQNKKISGSQFLNQIFDFLSTDETLNDTLAGYFNKILSNVLTSNGQFFNVVQNKYLIFDNLIKHVENRSIAEVIQKILVTVGSEKNYQQSKEDIFQDDRIYILKRLHQKLRDVKNLKTDEKDNINQIINEIFQQQNSYQQNNYPQTALNYLLSQEAAETYFHLLLQSDNLTTEANNLSHLVVYYNNKQKQKKNKQQKQAEEEDEVVIEEEDLSFPNQNLFLEQAPAVIQVLSKQLSNYPLLIHQTTYGETVNPFSSGKMRVVELIQHILASNNLLLFEELAKNNIFEIALQLMIQYPWNNLLHIQIEKIINEALNIVFEQKSEIVKKKLFEEFNILDFISDHSKNEYYSNQTTKKKIRNGYIGFLTNIAIKINENQSQYIKDQQSQSEKWNTYVSQTFENIISIQNKLLAGEDPKKKKEQPSISNDFDIQKIYEKFNNYFLRKNDEKKNASNEDIDENIESEQKDENQEEVEEDEQDVIQQETQQQNTEQQQHQKKRSEEQIDLIEQQEIESEYLIHNYWKVQQSHSIDKLMEDLDL